MNGEDPRSLDDIFQAKAEFHKSQARLPIEEKVRILVQLQKIVLSLHPGSPFDPPRRPWPLP